MNGDNCKTTCWLVAFAAGWLVGLFFWVGADWSFFWSLIAGVLVWLLSSVFLPRFFCSDVSDEPSTHSTVPGSSSSAVPPASPPKSEPTPKTNIAPTPDLAPDPETVTNKVTEPTPVPETGASQPPTESSDSVIKATTDLPGQNELAARKGSWRFEGTTTASQSATAPTKAGGGTLTEGGSQPDGLSAARDGGADNLKMIKGVGPKLEGVLNGLGFFHFDQIANWGAADVAWVDENILGFKGRVSRDNWVDQAKALAAGEETEFAKRAKLDGIYD